MAEVNGYYLGDVGEHHTTILYYILTVSEHPVTVRRISSPPRQTIAIQ